MLSFSQTEVFSENSQLSIKLLYSNYNNKQIIDKLAKSSNTYGSNFNYTVNIDFNRTINQPSANKNELIVNFNSMSIPNLKYKGFNMPKTLEPDLSDFKLKLIKNGTILKEFTLTDKKLSGQMCKETFVEPTSPDGGTPNKSRYMLSVYELKIKYSNAKVNEFNEWAGFVDQYETAYNNTNNQLNDLSTIPTDENVLASLPNIDDIEQYLVLAQNATNFVNATKRESFYRKLDVNNNDPQNLKQALEELSQKANILLTSCNNILSEIDLIYLDRGNLAYKQNKIDDAVHNYNKAIEHNPRLSAAHYMLAQIAFNNKDYEQSENILKNIFFNIGGDNQVLSDAENLSNQIYDRYISIGKNKISNQKYGEALVWLGKAQAWCNSINQVSCTSELKDNFQIAYEGKMNRLLSLVDQQVSNNQLTDAVELLNNAIKFRSEHISFLQEEQPIIDRSNDILDSYFNRAEQRKNSNNFNDAINDLLTAKKFCNNSSFINCPSDIDDKILSYRQSNYDYKISQAQSQINSNNFDDAERTLINADSYRANYNLKKYYNYDNMIKTVKQNQYDNFIAEGRNLYSSSQYQNAISKYEKAQDIENNNDIRKNRNLITYIQNAAKQLVLQKIETAEKSVVNNNLNSARQTTQEANDIAQKYDIMSDTEVATAFEDINKKIFNQQCTNYKNQYLQYYNLAIDKINAVKYIEADNYLYQAINLANAHVECSISMTDSKNKKQEIADAVEYQKTILDVTKNANKSYQTAIDLYIKAGGLYNTNNLNTRYNIYHKPLDEFIVTQNNGFVFYSVDYYLQKDNIDASFKMLKTLQSRNYNKKDTKNLQLLLGVKAAERDFSNQPSGVSKILVLQYTNGDKWYKYFTKSYKKTWKKLD